ncbi:Nn.00g053870.m01.CDS01 [Neocucurbitaria sp. VM-36]
MSESSRKLLQQYRHEPLEGPRSTRVLELHPARDGSSAIRCSLKAISLDDYPQWKSPYIALSYTWDGQTPSCEVDCDGSGLLITPNCDSALRQLRSTTEKQTLWIDSICIDQRTNPASLAERSYHVALMGEIYKSAAKVVVWLGEKNEPVEAAINKMMEMAEFVQKMGTGGDRRAAQEALRDHAKQISDSVNDPSDDPFGPLFECSWFYRMWTIQEVSLAFVDRIVLRCGTLEVPWPAIVIGLDALKTSKYRWGRWKEATSLQKQFVTYLLVRRYEGARAMLDDGKGTYHNDPIAFDILTKTRQKLAGDPKDKVLALYGLFRELEVPFPSPDYNLPVEDIYREATVASIKYDKNLYILYHVPSDLRNQDLASWVPDWSQPGFEPHDPRYGVLRNRFAASGPGDHIYSFSEDKKALILRGKIVDTIIYKADAMPDTKLSKLALNSSSERAQDDIVAREDEYMHIIHITCTILKSWVEVSKWGDYPTGESSKEALQRTLVADNPENNAIAGTGNVFNDWYEAMGMDELDLLASGLQRMDNTQIPRLPPLLRAEFLRRMKAQVSDEMANFLAFGSNRFHTIAHVWAAMKCFFYTEHEYFGTAPDPLPVSILPDDKIVIVSGLEMPLVIRPVEGGYKLITHVYLHGVMYGEMWPSSPDELEDIILL